MIDKVTELLNLNNNPDARFWKVGFELLTWPEQVFRIVWGLMGEVDNGGFDQFYFNSSGDTAYLAPKALHAIKAFETSEIVSEANSLFPATNPAIEDFLRQYQLENLSVAAARRLDELDNAYYDSTDDIECLLYDFVIANRQSIAGSDILSVGNV
jgi:hypothetical protein